MAQEITLETPLDSNFKFDNVAVKFLVENIHANTVAIDKPLRFVAPSFTRVGGYVILTPVSFHAFSDWRVHFEIIKEDKDDKGPSWQLHFESERNLKPTEQSFSEVRKITKQCIPTLALLKIFRELFPEDSATQYEWRDGWFGSKTRLCFKPDREIKTMGDALEVFDAFYALIWEAVNNLDLNELRSNNPEAFEPIKLFRLSTAPLSL